jgi:hypothetical protein
MRVSRLFSNERTRSLAENSVRARDLTGSQTGSRAGQASTILHRIMGGNRMATRSGSIGNLMTRAD